MTCHCNTTVPVGLKSLNAVTGCDPCPSCLYPSFLLQKWPLPFHAMPVDEVLLQTQVSGSTYVVLDNLDVKQSSKELLILNSFQVFTRKVQLGQGILFI